MNEHRYFMKIKPEQFFLNSYEISRVIIGEVIIISISIITLMTVENRAL